MATFNFKKAANPVNTPVVITDKFDKNPITFLLKPNSIDTSFLCNRWKHLLDQQDKPGCDELQFDIGLSRIASWTEGVSNEDGQPVPFNQQNFAMFLQIVEAIDYVMNIGRLTLSELKLIPDFLMGSSPRATSESEPVPGGILPEAEIVCQATVIPASS